MSDLNDLIHTNAVIAFQQGEQRERERIIKLLEGFGLHKDRCEYPGWCEFHCRADTYQFVIQVIKGDANVENIV